MDGEHGNGSPLCFCKVRLPSHPPTVNDLLHLCKQGLVRDGETEGRHRER